MLAPRDARDLEMFRAPCLKYWPFIHTAKERPKEHQQPQHGEEILTSMKGPSACTQTTHMSSPLGLSRAPFALKCMWFLNEFFGINEILNYKVPLLCLCMGAQAHAWI